MKPNNSIQSITIGSFDGLHLAHQALISQADMLVVIERNGGYLTAGYKRSLYTNKPITIYHFDKIKSLTPKEFVIKLKQDFPKLKSIVVGYDFHFGKDKAGNGDVLKELFDGDVHIVKRVAIGDTVVHSRTIKKLLREGNIETANSLLGRRYCIDGKHIKGQGLGEQKLVPTMNLSVEHYQLPLEGVYATRTKIDDKWMPSISFLGHRVSTDGSFAIETHILDLDIDTNNHNIWVEFIDSIRPNRKFNSLEELKHQIKLDIIETKKVLGI